MGYAKKVILIGTGLDAGVGLRLSVSVTINGPSFLEYRWLAARAFRMFVVSVLRSWVELLLPHEFEITIVNV